MTKIEPLSIDQHSGLKIKPVSGFKHVAEQHIVPIVAHEFAQVGADTPIVFVKHAETGQFQPVAMLGLQPGENLLVKDNRWQGMYIPGIIATWPFRLIANEQDPNKLAVALDVDSESVNEEEGEVLFVDGKESEFLEQRKKALTAYFEHSQITQAFVQYLAELDLLDEQSLSVDVLGRNINLTGLHFVSEKKLNELDDEKFADLRKRGFLHVIYAHLVSLGQIRRLGKTKAELGDSAA